LEGYQPSQRRFRSGVSGANTQPLFILCQYPERQRCLLTQVHPVGGYRPVRFFNAPLVRWGATVWLPCSGSVMLEAVYRPVYLHGKQCEGTT
jgi:hypothetical protein